MRHWIIYWWVTLAFATVARGDYEEAVAKAAERPFVLIEYASWCGRCEPYIKSLSHAGITVYKQQNEKLARAPKTMVYSRLNGVWMRTDFEGAQKPEAIQTAIDAQQRALLASAPPCNCKDGVCSAAPAAPFSAANAAVPQAQETLVDLHEARLFRPCPRPQPNPEPGPVGPQGPPGRDGKDGKDGPPGPVGPMGMSVKGKDGLPGPAGKDGKDGATGPAGKDGVDGKPGPQGPQGPAAPPLDTTTLPGITFIMVVTNPDGSVQSQTEPATAHLGQTVRLILQAPQAGQPPKARLKVTQ